jgi:hypothetical protein
MRYAKRIIITVLAFCFAGAIYSTRAEKIWEEEDGLVVIEAENYDENLRGNPGPWKKATSLSGYTGSGYMDPSGGKGGGTSVSYGAIDNKITYKIKFNTPGTYLLKMRNNHPGTDSQNDVWVSMYAGGDGKDDFVDFVSTDDWPFSDYDMPVDMDYRWRKNYDSDSRKWTWCDDYGHFYSWPVKKPGVYPVQFSPRNGLNTDRFCLIRQSVHEDEWGPYDNPESPVNQDQLKASDTQAPSAPTGLTAANARATTVDLHWTASPESDVWRYEIFANDKKIGATSKTQFVARYLMDNTNYSFTITAKDFAGNRSAFSSLATAKTIPFTNLDGKGEAQGQYSIKKVTQPPSIDARDNDGAWDDVESMHVYRPVCLDKSGTSQWACPHDIGSEEDCSGDFKAVWDDDNFYFFVSVKDDSKKADNRSPTNKYDWQDDGVEIIMGVDGFFTPNYTPWVSCWRFAFGYNFFMEIGHSTSGPTTSKFYKEGVEYNFISTDDGYDMEMKIPMRTALLKPKHNHFIALEVLIADDDNGGNGEGKVAWNDTKVQDRGRGPTKGIGKLVDPSVAPVGIGAIHSGMHAEIKIGYTRSTGRVTVENIPLGGTTISLFNTQGKLVRREVTSNTFFSISMGNAPGVYCVRIDGAGVNTMSPIVIDR